MDVKEYISKVKKMPQGFVPEGKIDYYYYLLDGHLTTNRINKMNNKEDEKFILYFSRWLWAWVRNHVDKNYELKPALWYHILKDITNSESEAIKLFFDLCDEFFETDEETLQKIIDEADEAYEMDDEDDE